MPTHEEEDRFLRDVALLTEEEYARFKAAVRKLVEDLRAGRPPRRGLRIRELATAPGVYELTWAPDGRATFDYGSPRRPNDPHIRWRRAGGHEIFAHP